MSLTFFCHTTAITTIGVDDENKNFKRSGSFRYSGNFAF